MSVQISELEIAPRAGEGAQQREAQQQSGQPQAPSPDKEHEMARSLALLHDRNQRLRAD
jgi:hypothetical protein